MSAVLRFAPSPNGRLHLGHAYSALLNERVARDLGGTWLLRIEDIDPDRSRADLEAAIRDDLAWLGLSWPEPVRRQSEHRADHRAAFEALQARGLVYPCTCTRGDIAREVARREAEDGSAWPRDPDGAPLYPGTCRLHAADRPGPAAWRLDMAAALAAVGEPPAWTAFGLDGALRLDGTFRDRRAEPDRWGDAVLVRKDVPTSYHVAVVVDDALQGITHVVRGADLEAATDLHVLLQRLLGLASPRYHHHRLLVDEAGAKLSKRAGSRSLAAIRDGGTAPEAIRTALGFVRALT